MNRPLPEKLVELAKKEIGVEEVDGTNCGPRVNEYKAATWLPADKPWPWCAAFICWLVREAMKGSTDKSGKPYTFQRPQTASAWDFENWSRKQDNSTQTKKPHSGDIKAGDVVIFTFSHIGLAVGNADNGYVLTVEGNTDAQGSREGGGVFLKRRKLSQIRSRIRFTV
jgi:ribosomal protein S6E (S10)